MLKPYTLSMILHPMPLVMIPVYAEIIPTGYFIDDLLLSQLTKAIRNFPNKRLFLRRFKG